MSLPPQTHLGPHDIHGDGKRLAIRLAQEEGLREFATVNLKDFTGLGFRRVFNPLA